MCLFYAVPFHDPILPFNKPRHSIFGEKMTEDDGIRYTVWRKGDGHSHDLTIDQTRVLDMFFFLHDWVYKDGRKYKEICLSF